MKNQCDLKTPDGYCRLDDHACEINPKSVGKREIDGVEFDDLEFPKGCRLLEVIPEMNNRGV